MPRAAYDQVVEHGILGPDDKIELLAGRLVVAEPKHSPHATGVHLVAAVYRTATTLSREHFVSPLAAPDTRIAVADLLP